VSQASWTSSLPEDTRKLATSGDKVLAFPVGRNAIVMAYNKKVFAAAGIAVPTTWSELLKACTALKAAGKTPIANPLQGGVYLQFWMYALAATMVYADNPDIDADMTAGRTSFAKDKGWNSVFGKYLELRDAGFFTEGALGVPPDQGLQAVAGGNTGMVLTVTPAVPQLTKFAKGGAADIGVFALPATENAAETRIPVAPDFVAVNAEGKNVEAAKGFLDFLAKPENVAAYANTMGVLPGLDVDVKVTNPGLEPIRPMIDGGRTAPYANYLWPNGDVQQTLLQSGQQWYAKSITTPQLLAQMDTEYAKGNP
jgi:raffinose/stachyose/melibiose transport system substrate-binding protein